jgi:hypothetical protein
MMRYVKYHALGNDYVVIPATDSTSDLQRRRVELICHRHYGVGSDGILFGPLQSEKYDFRLRILIPDGSEAEKSGNGMGSWNGVIGNGLRYLGIDCPPLCGESALVARKPRVHFPGHFIIIIGWKRMWARDAKAKYRNNQ